MANLRQFQLLMDWNRAWTTPFIKRSLAFGLLWLLLSGGEIRSLAFGVPAVIFAAVLAGRLAPESTKWPGPLALLFFVPWFFRQSFRGGVDVARRAFHPTLPLKPALLQHPFRLPPGTPRLFFVNCVSLLPGTLSAELQEEVLLLHVLDKGGEPLGLVRELEGRVADLFGVSGGRR